MGNQDTNGEYFDCRAGERIRQCRDAYFASLRWISYDPDTGETFLTWREEWQGFYDWCKDAEVKQKWVEIRLQLEQLPVTRQSFGFIHNDPHQYNLLADGDQITLLDFDVANHHWFANDLAIACQGLLFDVSGGIQRPVTDREALHTFVRLLLEGYSRENSLSPEWIERLDVFIAYRRILLFTVMQDWISSQPGLHAS
jgi:Ser/Thr protein kinase RdoA (MazF antagonist)